MELLGFDCFVSTTFGAIVLRCQQVWSQFRCEERLEERLELLEVSFNRHKQDVQIHQR